MECTGLSRPMKLPRESGGGGGGGDDGVLVVLVVAMAVW